MNLAQQDIQLWKEEAKEGSGLISGRDAACQPGHHDHAALTSPPLQLLLQ